MIKFEGLPPKLGHKPICVFPYQECYNLVNMWLVFALSVNDIALSVSMESHITDFLAYTTRTSTDTNMHA